MSEMTDKTDALPPLPKHQAVATDMFKQKARLYTAEQMRSYALEFAVSASARAYDRASGVCEAMVVGGRAWNEAQEAAANALLAAATNIRALAEQPAGAVGDGAVSADALGRMFPGLQSDLAKLTTGARLMESFENADWNQVRESLEGRVVNAATALMAHTEAAGMTLEKDGISVRISPAAYEGGLS